jgi:serine/threonine protein kinase
MTAGTVSGPTSAFAARGRAARSTGRDSRLGRDVAIKVLPAPARNPEITRFERRAAISSLNHPHICTLHDVGRAPGEAGSPDIEYLVMELIDGGTLAQRIAKGPAGARSAAARHPDRRRA